MNKYIAIIGGLLFLFGCKTAKESPPITEKNGNTQDCYTIIKGDCVEVSFIGNASLGMAWYWKNKEQVTVVDSSNVRYFQENPELIGSSSTLCWTFCAKHSGTDTLVFEFCPIYDQQKMIKQRKVVVSVQ